MLHKLIMGAFAMVLIAGIVLAEEVMIKGKVKSVDKDKNTITITVDDKDQTFTIPAGTKILMKGKKDMEIEAKGGLGQVKTGREVTITIDRKVEKVDDKEVTTDTVTKVLLERAPAKKPGKKNSDKKPDLN